MYDPAVLESCYSSVISQVYLVMGRRRAEEKKLSDAVAESLRSPLSSCIYKLQHFIDHLNMATIRILWKQDFDYLNWDESPISENMAQNHDTSET